MKLSAPKFITFLICVLAFLAAWFLSDTIALPFSWVWVERGSFILLALACMFKGL